MSFGDPFGPLRPGIGPYIVRTAPDGRSDLPLDFPEPVGAGWRQRLWSAVRFAALFAASSFALTALMATPILIGELAAVEAVTTHGQMLTAAQFVARLGNLLLGTMIVAVASVCFLASAFVSSRNVGVRAPDPAADTPILDRPVDPMLAALIKVRHV